MSRTRDQIIDLLERQKTATAAQLGRSLQVSAADIRFHLQQLIAAGQVEDAGKLRTGEPGRPRQLYRLAPPARESNLEGLAGALLRVVVSQLGNAGLQAAAQILAQGQSPEQTPTGRRLFRAVQQLNRLHYRARWEAHADSPRLVLGNCPYASIIDEYPELCQFDSQLIEHLSALPAEQTAKLETNPRGELFCLFQLQDTHPTLSAASE